MRLKLRTGRRVAIEAAAMFIILVVYLSVGFVRLLDDEPTSAILKALPVALLAGSLTFLSSPLGGAIALLAYWMPMYLETVRDIGVRFALLSPGAFALLTVFCYIVYRRLNR